MFGFIIRRTLWTIPVLLLAALITVSLVKALPYDDQVFSSNPKYSAQQVKELEKKFGLDKPFHEQYYTFVKNLVTGQLGVSTKPGNLEISEIVSQKLPVSMLLGVCAFFLSAVVGISLGLASALKVNGPVDYAVTLISTLAFAFPAFVTATLWVKYSPYYGWEEWSLRIGPIVLLGLSIMPYFIRLVRASMLEALQQEYVVTSRSKGLPWRTTVIRHALRNSLIPTVVNAGPLFGFVLTGSFIIEKIMSVPGIAGEFIKAFSQPIDNQLILVTTVLVSAVIIIMNLVVDVIVGWLDPRITHD
ncbi:MAG: oligopeptide transporter permease protein [Thermoleophilia bacterium]|nr:oligopeptide transporter permease protein [Thermoleophilia bacterium]